MAITGVSYGKFVLKELDPSANEFSENLAYVKRNLADVSSTDTTIQKATADHLSDFAKSLVGLTDNTLKSATISYDVGLDIS